MNYNYDELKGVYISDNGEEFATLPNLEVNDSYVRFGIKNTVIEKKESETGIILVFTGVVVNG